MQRVPMTIRGAERLREELQKLKQVDRPHIIKAIAEARAHGDLRENAEYHAAKEQQSFIEGRIADIEAKLSFAEVIDVTKIPNRRRVIFGTTIILSNLDDEREVTYQIVGDDEAHITEGRVSVNSPIARAVIGKEIGEVVVVVTPKGDVEFEIIDVQHV